jgi:hypothetical protein
VTVLREARDRPGPVWVNSRSGSGQQYNLLIYEILDAMTYYDKDRTIEEVVMYLKQRIAQGEREGERADGVASVLVSYLHGLTTNIEQLEKEYPPLGRLVSEAENLEYLNGYGGSGHLGVVKSELDALEKYINYK